MKIQPSLCSQLQVKTKLRSLMSNSINQESSWAVRGIYTCPKCSQVKRVSLTGKEVFQHKGNTCQECALFPLQGQGLGEVAELHWGNSQHTKQLRGRWESHRRLCHTACTPCQSWAPHSHSIAQPWRRKFLSELALSAHSGSESAAFSSCPWGHHH